MKIRNQKIVHVTGYYDSVKMNCSLLQK